MSQTNFFSTIAPMIEGVNIQLTIKKVGDRLNITFLPQADITDDAKNRIGPMLFNKALPTDLDEKFFEAISKPTQQVSNWALQVKNFEKQIEEAQANSQLAKKQKEEREKEEKKLGKEVVKAKELAKEEKYRQAIGILDKYLQTKKDDQKAKDLRKEYADHLLNKEGDLFAEPKQLQ